MAGSLPKANCRQTPLAGSETLSDSKVQPSKLLQWLATAHCWALLQFSWLPQLYQEIDTGLELTKFSAILC
jgi:hypothetical protein